MNDLTLELQIHLDLIVLFVWVLLALVVFITVIWSWLFLVMWWSFYIMSDTGLFVERQICFFYLLLHQSMFNKFKKKWNICKHHEDSINWFILNISLENKCEHFNFLVGVDLRRKPGQHISCDVFSWFDTVRSLHNVEQCSQC